MRKGRTTKPATVSTTIVLPQLISIAEAAMLARVSKPTIVRAYVAGELRVFRTPRGGRVLIHADSLGKWITRNSVGGAR